MNDTILIDSIRRYILGGNGDTDIDINLDIDEFEITKFDYRNIFDKEADQNVSHLELIFKFLGAEDTLDADFKCDDCKWYFADNPDRWKELFIFFCVMPFTEYEFQGKDLKLLNPDTLQNVYPSDERDEKLIETFSGIEFESMNQEIMDDRLAANLQRILRTDIFSNDFKEHHRKILRSKLYFLGLHLHYDLVKNVSLKDESTYRTNFLRYLFEPICDYIAALLRFKIEVEENNYVGQTGVHSRVPHTTDDIFYSYTDIVAYAEKHPYRSLAVVEAKKMPLLVGDKVIDFKDSRLRRFFTQVVAEMFSNHTNKGILTDSYTIVLVEIDIERSLEAIENRIKVPEGNKPIALNYKVLNCHSSGLTLRGGLFSFIYEAFNVNESRMNEIEGGLDRIYMYIRKTDEEYLTSLDKLAEEDEASYRSFCKDEIKGNNLFDTVIKLGDFADIDVQCGFKFNSQLFKVKTQDVLPYLKEDVSVTEQLIVKVYDPIKARRDYDSDDRFEKTILFDHLRKVYEREKKAYETLMSNEKFNSIYIDQEQVFGKFNIGEHYHALGPFIILKYLNHTKCPLDKETYLKAAEQLKIIHDNEIFLGEIRLQNILYCEGKVYFIDFGYLNYATVRLRDSDIRSQHVDLCYLFGQPIPEKYKRKSTIK